MIQQHSTTRATSHEPRAEHNTLIQARYRSNARGKQMSWCNGLEMIGEYKTDDKISITQNKKNGVLLEVRENGVFIGIISFAELVGILKSNEVSK